MGVSLSIGCNHVWLAVLYSLYSEGIHGGSHVCRVKILAEFISTTNNNAVARASLDSVPMYDHGHAPRPPRGHMKNLEVKPD